MNNSIERDEYDLWAESSEEATRKALECNRLTMLVNLDKWIEDAFSFIDTEMHGSDNDSWNIMEVQDE